ncbi:MAG: hypothetical protein ACREFI_18135, partial [Stellaceae bacterium]
MPKALRSVPLVLFLAVACGGPDLTDADQADLEYGTSVHKLPLRDASAPLPQATSAHLTYYGGKVLSSVKVVQVLYGSGTYAAPVSQMAAFYGGVTKSTYMDWLKEYDTPKQSIGRGSFAKKVSITPSASRDKASISDASIQAEISAQIGKGTLPAPDGNTLYMVNFPKGKTITQGGSKSCVGGGFCAYHGTFKRNSTEVFYGVLPDMSAGSGCDQGCGSGSALANQTSVASHEMIESVTDAEVGLATKLGSPLAWYDSTNGEIGDICNG